MSCLLSLLRRVSYNPSKCENTEQQRSVIWVFLWARALRGDGRVLAAISRSMEASHTV